MHVPVETWNPGIIVFDGDSLTAGDGVQASEIYCQQAINQLTAMPATTMNSFINSGTSGETISQMVADVTTDVDSHFLNGNYRLKRKGFGNVACLLGGTNDLFQGVVKETIRDRWISWMQGRRNIGWRLVASTITPCTEDGTPESFESSRLWINDFIREHYEYYDALADYASAPEAMDTTNSTYYQSDRVHWKAALHQVLGINYTFPALIAAIG